jgi:hypothetical protein
MVNEMEAPNDLMADFEIFIFVPMETYITISEVQLKTLFNSIK